MSTTTTATHRVTLINMADGSVQGHRAGCADIARGKGHADTPWTLEVTTKAEAREAYNGDFDEEIDGWYDIDWLPCAQFVPESITTPDTTTTTNEEPAMNTIATTTTQFTTADLGDGNWEVTAPNGVWTITADTAEVTPDTVFHIEGPNHHFPELWSDTLGDALALVEVVGQDGRTARQTRADLALTITAQDDTDN